MIVSREGVDMTLLADAAINQKKAEADMAYDLQKFKTGQAVRKEEIQVAVIEKEPQITVQEGNVAAREAIGSHR